MKTTFLLILVVLITAVQALALPDPDDIEKWNLEAELIVYGQVANVDLSADSPYFQLIVQTVVKPVDGVNAGDTITVYCDPMPNQSNVSGLEMQQPGVVYVRVNEGNHVIAYLNGDGEGNYKPVLQGLSVVITEALSRP